MGVLLFAISPPLLLWRALAWLDMPGERGSRNQLFIVSGMWLTISTLTFPALLEDFLACFCKSLPCYKIEPRLTFSMKAFWKTKTLAGFHHLFQIHTRVWKCSHGFSLSSWVWVLVLTFLSPLLSMGIKFSPERVTQFDTTESIRNRGSLKKKMKSYHFNSTDGPRGYYATWNKSVTERQIPFNFISCVI